MTRDDPPQSSRPPRSLKGRAALSNVPNRYEPHHVEPFDDGWGSLEQLPQKVPTTATPEASRTILTTNDSPDVPFDVSINPYKGCEHGCIYCFARPTHAYLGLSPGIDFETRIVTKPDAPEVLRKTLSRGGYRPRPIALGTNTDPYQPLERRLKITRGILEVLAEFRHPFSVVTKSNLVLRDLDLIAPAASSGRAAVYLSVTTLDRGLARAMEPRAATPERRIEALGRLSAAGVPTGVLASPMIPALNDHELERILEASAEAGAGRANYILIRLPLELKTLFVEWLETHFPDRASKVLAQVEAMRGGKLYDGRYGERMRGGGPFADLLARRFEAACRRLGLNRRARDDLDTTAFRVPGATRSLFD